MSETTKEVHNLAEKFQYETPMLTAIREYFSSFFGPNQYPHDIMKALQSTQKHTDDILKNQK